MSYITRWALVLTVAFMAAVALPNNADACTGITLTAEDDSVVFARTMELGGALVEWGLVVVPQGTSYVGTTPWESPGVKWTAKYAFVGMNSYGTPYVADGVNEAGLAAGTFMFAHYTEYQTPTELDAGKTLAAFELTTWILSNFSTVAEVKEGLAQVKVAAVVLESPGWDEAPPFHWIVVDESGAAIVVEYVAGELTVHDNPLGVITNAPTFDWHITNLKSYVNLSAEDASSSELGGLTLTAFGHGSGMLGLPGDFTPPSRFVRAAFLKSTVVPAKDATETVVQAFHILNQFDIPLGAVRGVRGGQPLLEQTDWTSAADLKNRRYYIHTADTRRIHMIDLMQAPRDGTAYINIPLPQEEVFEDLTPAEVSE